MATTAAVSEEEMMEIARQMHAEGTLTGKGLRAKCVEFGGKADYKRCLDVMGAVRKEAEEAKAGAALLKGADGQPSDSPEAALLSPAFLEAVHRLPALAAKEIGTARGDEMARARIQEAALRAEHAREIEEVRGEMQRVGADLHELTEEAARLDAELDQAQARIVELEQVAADTEMRHNDALREMQQDRQRVERLLEQATTAERQANEDRTRAELARQAAETELTHLRLHVEDLRQEMTGLRSQGAEMERRLATAERERDVALARAEAALLRAEAAERREESALQRLHRGPPATRSVAGRKRKAETAST